eukprot:TRINITY_DN288_c0_g1_i2.p1 TRINITY_DN288_c0_g1~~TRINITY_DN288_c0_g1_i2.p1  ORF type:complete len:194 (+),score=49.65 TRINITY_DN288_c0_g1_i2:62-583(+)
MKAVLALLLLAIVCVHAGHVDFGFHFHGKCEGTPRTYCRGKANSQELRTEVSPVDGVKLNFHELFGSYAEINGVITAGAADTFHEVGNITFGTHLNRAHAIYYRTIGEGQYKKIGDRYVAVASYDVVSGGGIFKGVRGVITVNSFTDKDGFEALTVGTLEAPLVPEGPKKSQF